MVSEVVKILLGVKRQDHVKEIVLVQQQQPQQLFHANVHGSPAINIVGVKVETFV